jgi:hypothetical protein
MPVPALVTFDVGRHLCFPFGEEGPLLIICPDKIHGKDADDLRKLRWFPVAESGSLNA